jgi:hypothetical protein
MNDRGNRSEVIGILNIEVPQRNQYYFANIQVRDVSGFAVLTASGGDSLPSE